MLSANTVAQNPAGSVIPPLSSAQVGFVVVGCASRAANNDPVASTKPMMRVARGERRDSESTIRIGFMLLRRVLFNRPCDRRSLISGFSVCLVSRHHHQWFRRRRPGAGCADPSFLARTRQGPGGGRDPTLRIPANTSWPALRLDRRPPRKNREPGWAGPANGPKEEVMTNRAHQWKRRALFAMLLVLPGLSGCTSGMSALGEPPAASDVDVDPWPRQLASGDDTFSLFQPQYERDRKSTRLNSSHVRISYAVFCLKKKNSRWLRPPPVHRRRI